MDSARPGSEFTKKIGEAWCRIMHESPMWPIHGQYQCRRCLRRFPVPWEARASAAKLPSKAGAGLRSALFAALIFAAAGSSARAWETPPPDANAMSALARYEITQKQSDPWTLETVQIDAALPHLSKQGRMRVIRRLIPPGHPEYQMVEFTGDQLIKQQVMVRYLNLDAQTAETPAASVAITSSNYRFHFKHVVNTPNGRAYSFQITPRQKRAGLIKGELWVDSATGIPVRLSGYLVKSPSLFVKRIQVTRDLSIRDGVIEARLTHLSINTRVAGQAELIIVERPYSQADDSEVADGHK